MNLAMLRTIRVRLVAVVLLVCVVMLSMVLWSMQRSHERAHRELFEAYDPTFAARLLAQGVGTGVDGGEPARADATLRQMVGLNPTVDLYWVNREGTVLASSTGRVAREFEQIPHDMLTRLTSATPDKVGPGIDPRFVRATKPVAVEPIDLGGAPGYLYIVHKDLSLLASVAWSDLAWLVGCWIGLTALAAHFALRGISDPLTRLAQNVESLDTANPSMPATEGLSSTAPSEIRRLEHGIGGLAKRIADQVRALKAADEERRVLFAAISHDLRTPISSLSGYIETVASRDHLGDEERKRLCAVSLDETKLLVRLLDDLMDLARLESPEMKIDREPFPLSEAVAIVYRRFKVAAATKNVSLLVPGGLEACPPLDADPAMVERLLGNLVQNAIEHTPPGGMVRVDARLAGMWAEIQVTDTGPGIPPDQVTHIFERFYRGPSSAGTAKSGLGLGLAIAKRIVELHGGEIRARSPPVRGASFRFTLPLVRESSEQISFPARSENRSSSSSHEPKRGEA